MIGLGHATRIYLGVEPVDMRKGFEGLYGLVRDTLGHDPLSGVATFAARSGGLLLRKRIQDELQRLRR